MKQKILISGNNSAIIDDFYAHTESDFICMTSSLRKSDLKLHIQLFQPNAFVYCLSKENECDYNTLLIIKSLLEDTDTILVILGEKYDLTAIEEFGQINPDISLSKPINIKKIQDTIIKYLEDRRIEREVAQRKQLEEQALAEKNAKKHILVIDDDPIMLRSMKHYLEESYVVATAPSGKFALKFLEQKHTDLILLDYEMPEMSGSEVMKQIRSNEALKDIPMIFLTGVSDVSRIKAVLAMHPTAYLLKPVEYDRLHETIQNVFG